MRHITFYSKSGISTHIVAPSSVITIPTAHQFLGHPVWRAGSHGGEKVVNSTCHAKLGEKV